MGFCTRCGTALVDGVCPNCTASNAGRGYGSSFDGHLMNPNEKIVCVLGNTYMQNFLAGGIFQKAFSVVSDKRVYFRGTVYEELLGRLRKRKITKAVNIRDITGISVTTIFPLSYIIVGALFLLLGLILLTRSGWFLLLGLLGAGANALLFYFHYRTILKIEYAGGAIGFEIKWFPQEESLTYQKTIFLAKDKIFESE